MAWPGLNPMFDWIWRTLTPLWRLLTGIFYPLLRFFAKRLTWRKNETREPEVSEEKEDPSFPEPALKFECEGQHEASSGKRVANFDSEPFSKRQKYEEEEEEFDSKEYRVEPTDELYCGYDSTWETEQSQESSFKNSRRSTASRYYKFSRFENAARDMQNYRRNYPNQTKIQRWKQQASDKPNLKFYIGQARTLPDGVHIEEFHTEWYGEYDTLEYVHSYIQWLFPLQEPGMNFEATPLTKEEINEFLKSNTAKENLLKSYKLMLDFYGIELSDVKTGEVKRAWNWSDRFNNLDSHTHNNLRITRILKCLGTLGYCHYQAPLVRFFLEETLVHGELPHVKDSVLNYFLFAVLDKRERRRLIKFAFLNYDRKDEFVWCPKKIQKLWSKSPRQVSDKVALSVEYECSQ